MEPDLSLELALHREGYGHIAGLDEAGRGSWAGPVVAAAVVLPLDDQNLPAMLPGLRDSKLLSARQREALFPLIHRAALGVGVGIVAPAFIDRQGIMAATREAMRQALTALPRRPSYLLIDYLQLPEVLIPQRGIPKGDRKHSCIAAASVVAKVTRDRIMVDMDGRYPGYGFAQHKGYGTTGHRSALRRLGPCGIHRLSFAPMCAMAEEAREGLRIRG